MSEVKLNPFIVAKFGGSSVKDAEAMRQVARVVLQNSKIKVVIISATYNTTNQLEFVAQAALRGDDLTLNNVILEIKNKHLKIAADLNVSTQVTNELNILFNELVGLGFQISKDKSYTPKTMDLLYSLGERMSSLIISDHLRQMDNKRHVVFVDARKIIKTNSDFQKAEPQIDLIEKNAKELILNYHDQNALFVTQGFIGEDLQGFTTTLGREGSDYSAALLGEAINASEIQIWTDVPGIASTDPRVCSDAVYIPKISYDEATAMASLGAKVLFPRTLEPAKRKSIPVFVGSTKNPEAGGSYVVKEKDKDYKLKAVSLFKKADSKTLVSVIGSELHLNKNLGKEFIGFLEAEKIHAKLVDTTSVSLSVETEFEDRNRLNQVAHKFLFN